MTFQRKFMNMKRALLWVVSSVLVFAATSAKEPVEWVNPFIGTTNFGTTNPGAVMPNGLMSVSPFNVMGSDQNRFAARFFQPIGKRRAFIGQTVVFGRFDIRRNDNRRHSLARSERRTRRSEKLRLNRDG